MSDPISHEQPLKIDFNLERSGSRPQTPARASDSNENNERVANPQTPRAPRMREQIETSNVDKVGSAIRGVGTSTDELPATNPADIDGAVLHGAVANVMADEDKESREKKDEGEEGQGPYSSRIVLQEPLSSLETFRPHPTDPKKVIATFCVPLPSGGGYFLQVNEIPELETDPDAGNEMAENILPGPNAAKITRKARAKRNQPSNLWKAATDHNWTRRRVVNGQEETETYRPTIIFRRFDVDTHKYVQAYASPKKLENADPNDKNWMYAYNKWIDQINRRRNVKYEKQVSRNHWTVPETRALYNAINSFCRANGVHNFGCNKGARMTDPQLRAIADAVNVIGNSNRNVDAVRGKINTAHETKDKVLKDLREEAVARREYMAAGGILSQDEAFPQNVIVMTAFPNQNAVDPNKSKKSSSDGQKQEEMSDVEDADETSVAGPSRVNEPRVTSSSASSPKRKRVSASENLDDEAAPASVDGHAGYDVTEEFSTSSPSKKRKLATAPPIKPESAPSASSASTSRRAVAPAVSMCKTSTTATQIEQVPGEECDSRAADAVKERVVSQAAGSSSSTAPSNKRKRVTTAPANRGNKRRTSSEDSDDEDNSDGLPLARASTVENIPPRQRAPSSNNSIQHHFDDTEEEEEEEEEESNESTSAAAPPAKKQRMAESAEGQATNSASLYVPRRQRTTRPAGRRMTAEEMDDALSLFEPLIPSTGAPRTSQGRSRQHFEAPFAGVEIPRGHAEAESDGADEWVDVTDSDGDSDMEDA